MRQRINPIEEPAPEDPAASLRDTFALLLPIRRQRLRRSEREQRQHEQQLEHLRAEARRADEQLTQRQSDYQRLRAGFDTAYLGHQPFSRLQRGLQQEERAAGAVQRQRQAVCESAAQCAAQSEKLAAARSETQLRQRELEKLEMLMQENEVQS
ncbi:hypothetical protein LQ939_02970 [Pantoea alhagi]|uniref:hypothetical protein n=1 Tax=Pantoea alhagi TaxID=1891675 RepID=UPI00202B4C84|nr:hypothetical protein [Pantoea alhagi]URQ61340.1 hypothetical protein LQ939_02970 [Pantoea alhagi]